MSQQPNQIRTIKNILQDSILRIPYFLSPSKPTSTLAIAIDPENAERESQDVMWVVRGGRGVVDWQWKVWYGRDGDWGRTLVVRFQGVEQAEQFYGLYARNYDKIYSPDPKKQPTPNQQPHPPTPKYHLFYSKDLTNSHTDMQQILYTPNKLSVQVPESLQLRNIIKQIAKLIVVEGIRAETEIVRYRADILSADAVYLLDFMDAKFVASEAVYYRWRVYSYLQGDGETSHRLQPFQLTPNGPLYYPPTEHAEKYQTRILTHAERSFITRLLESLSCRKFHIEEAMAFCIANTGAAVEICCVIAVAVVDACGRLGEDDKEKEKGGKGGEVKNLVALFYLISDILFNSPSTIYRDIFTVLLPALIHKLPNLPELTPKILSTLETWHKKFILEDEFLRGLKLTLTKDLSSMKPLGMQQMTRAQHECYKELIKLETTDEIEELCCKYGIFYGNGEKRVQEALRNLAATIAVEKRESLEQEMEPEPGVHDGEPLNQKDLQKIKSKACRVVSLEDINIRYLFDRDKTSKSISHQKQ